MVGDGASQLGRPCCGSGFGQRCRRFVRKRSADGFRPSGVGEHGSCQRAVREICEQRRIGRGVLSMGRSGTSRLGARVGGWSMSGRVFRAFLLLRKKLQVVRVCGVIIALASCGRVRCLGSVLRVSLLLDLGGGREVACVVAAALARADVAFGDKLVVCGLDGDQTDAQLLGQRAFRG